ncbi:MAG: hypothetical protein HQM14_09975 [SAR324 cluster bacterium]|nr:hypothetical protein [SAR324 cluster bacterium]
MSIQSKPNIFFIVLFLIFFFTGIPLFHGASCLHAQVEDPLFAEEANESTEDSETFLPVPNDMQVLWSGLIDLRFAYTGKAKRWQDGGRGITRYGGIDTDKDGSGDRQTSIFKLPQASLVAEALIDGDVRGYLQMNYNDHDDKKYTSGQLGVIEAYIRYDRLKSDTHSITARLGRVIPSISLEHPDVAWSTHYTITPSAINAWVGEELRPIAFEINYEYSYAAFSHIEFMVAPYSGNDPSGEVLSWRGWALHDYQAPLGSRLKFQKIDPVALRPDDQWGEPFKELDGRMGIYTKIGWSPSSQWEFEGFYSNSMADTEIVDSTNEYAWQTEFTHLSLEYHPSAEWAVLSQGMMGNTWMGNPKSPGVNNDFHAWYLLLSYTPNSHRFTVRYDDFRVIDLDRFKDKNDSRGTAITLAYLFLQKESHLFGMEYLHADSHRIGNEGYDKDKDPDDDLYQAMYRLIF